MMLSIRKFFKEIWRILWDTEIPTLLQIVGFALTIWITHVIDVNTADADRRAGSLVAQVHSFENDATVGNVQFNDFSLTIIRPEMAAAADRQKLRDSMTIDRERTRTALMDDLVRQIEEARNFEGTVSPQTLALLQKYTAKTQTFLEVVRTTDDYDALRNAYHAWGDMRDVQMDLLPALRKESGLTV